MRTIREEYDHISPRYEMRWRMYIQRSVDETLVRADIHSGERVLDIGCGTGALLHELARRSVRAVGADVSMGMLARARFCGASLAAGDAELLPFRNESFDIVMTSSSFHLWPHPERGLNEIRRVMRSGGQLVITDWCDDFVACRLCNAYLRLRDPSYQRIFSKSECIDQLERSGFRVLRIEAYKISWLWGLMTAVANVARSRERSDR